MKKLYATIAAALMALTANAQTDTLHVCIDFNQNPWNLPVSIPNRDLDPNGGWGINWAKVDDETGCFLNTHTFDWNVSEGETIQLVLTPSNWKLTDYMNAMVKTHNLDMADEPIETMLWMRRGSTLTFKAPDSYWFAYVKFGEYRNWASGSLHSGDDTNSHHVWHKDSVKTKTTMNAGQELVQECWSGDSIEWSLPECTGNTYLRTIDVWLLPRKGINTGIANWTVANKPRRKGLFDLTGRKLNAVPRRGAYICDGQIIVK